MSRRSPERCPVFHRDLLSVVAPTRSDKKSLPEISTRPQLGAWNCRGSRPGVARFFTATCFRLSLRRGQTKNHCPKLQRALASVVTPARPGGNSLTETSTQHYFGAWNCRGGRPGVARFFTATCFRLSLRRGQTKNHCPKFQRDLSSVHGIVAAVARALPGFSPRLAFGCHSGAAGRKLVDRNFNATLLRCMELSRQWPGHCPVFHRALLSVVAPTRSDKKSLPETTARPYFGVWICRGSRPGVARFFTATCFRLSPGYGQTKIHCPKFQRDLSSVHRFVAAVARALPGFSPRLAFGCRPGIAA